MFHRHERFRSWIPHGFDYLSPTSTRERRQRQDQVRRIFEEAGYAEITPPSLDFAGTFSLTAREHSGGPVFRLRAAEGEELAIRSDLTVQVVKAVANRRLGTKFPARFAYIQPVFQDRAWGSGHKREILQAGVELVGETAPGRFREILDLAKRCVRLANIDARILYGDVRFVEHLFALAPEEARADLSQAFYNKDSALIERICAERGLDPALRRILAEVPLTFGQGPETLDRLVNLCRQHPPLLAVLEEARAHQDVIYDFSLVRELSYYTGPVFEAYIPGSNEKIFTGGVYDGLYAEFSGEQKTACGFALNLSILVENQL